MSLRSEPTAEEKEGEGKRVQNREKVEQTQDKIGGINHIKWRNKIPNSRGKKGEKEMWKEKGQRKERPM